MDVSERLSLILTEKTRQNREKILENDPKYFSNQIKEKIQYKFGDLDKLYKTKLRLIEGLQGSKEHENVTLSLETSCLILQALIIFTQDYEGEFN